MPCGSDPAFSGHSALFPSTVTPVHGRRSSRAASRARASSQTRPRCAHAAGRTRACARASAWPLMAAQRQRRLSSGNTVSRHWMIMCERLTAYAEGSVGAVRDRARQPLRKPQASSGFRPSRVAWLACRHSSDRCVKNNYKRVKTGRLPLSSWQGGGFVVRDSR